MTRLWPSLIGAVQVVQPETILRWHRAGFKVFWRLMPHRRRRVFVDTPKGRRSAGFTVPESADAADV